MAETEPIFPAGAYVVNYGRRGVIGTLAAALAWTAVTIVVILSGRPVIADTIVAVIEAGVLLTLGVDLARAARHEVVLAVHEGGVYFGSDRIKDDVPWSRISAVEFFREYQQNARARTAHRCIGVRSQGTKQLARPGNGAAARPVPARSVEYMIRAGRADLLPGADGTIRYSYRKMKGWRADRQRVTDAVRRYAPGVPVIDGPNWPAQITRADAFAARRARG